MANSDRALRQKKRWSEYNYAKVQKHKFESISLRKHFTSHINEGKF